MNNYQRISIKDREYINHKLLEMFTGKEIETNGEHQNNILTYIKVLNNVNTFNLVGVFNQSKNLNIVLNVYFWKKISLPNNSYVTKLPNNVLAIIFDDDIIGIHGNKISLSPFYSCVILKP